MRDPQREPLGDAGTSAAQSLKRHQEGRCITQSASFDFLESSEVCPWPHVDEESQNNTHKPEV